MKHILTLAACLSLVASGPAFANAHKEAPAMGASGAMTTQQSKMGTCNKEAGDKKGDERKAFMKTCLSTNTKMTQQDKMKKCNADATTTAKKGDERKAFMKECLSA